MASGNVAMIEQFFAVMVEEGAAVAARRFGADDLVWWSPGFGEIQDGLDGMSALIDANFVGGRIDMFVDAITDGGDRIAVEARSQGTLNDGTAYANQYHWLFVVKDGKIAVIKEYNDTAHLKQVLGAILGG